MRELLLEWQDLWIPEYVPRKIDGSVLEGDVNKINLFTGCRRAGKTYMMFQVIDQLHREWGIEREDIVYIDFEDERLEWETDVLKGLLPTLVEMYGERDYHLFLDEIHHIPRWDRWVRRVYDRYRNMRIYLTSSSSRLSSKEIPGSLRGRTLVFDVFPLSFKEFASFNGESLPDPKRLSSVNRGKMARLLDEYMDFGGFPEVVMESSKRRKKSIIQDYFKTIVALDICDRYNIQNVSLVHDYIKLVLGQTMYSTNKMYNILRSGGRKVGKETLLDYSRYLEEVYFSFFLEIFSPKVKDRLQYPRKVYFVDNSFINHIIPSVSEGLGRRMENLVFLHLLKRHGKDSIFYWKDRDGHEIDFVIVEGEKVKMAIQTCYDINDTSTKKRELSSLLNGAEELGCEELIVVTWDKKGKEKLDGYTVRFIPLYNWLYENEPGR